MINWFLSFCYTRSTGWVWDGQCVCEWECSLTRSYYHCIRCNICGTVPGEWHSKRWVARAIQGSPSLPPTSYLIPFFSHIAGLDYASSTQLIEFLSSGSRQAYISILNDTVFEGNESFTARLRSTPMNGVNLIQDSLNITILEDDSETYICTTTSHPLFLAFLFSLILRWFLSLFPLLPSIIPPFFPPFSLITNRCHISVPADQLHMDRRRWVSGSGYWENWERSHQYFHPHLSCGRQCWG